MFNKYAYVDEFNKNAYDNFTIRLPKGAKQIVQQYCQQKGLSINQLVSQCLLWEMGLKDWKDAINGKDNDRI